MSVKLIVIRCADLPAMAAFYALLGFEPVYHRHGSSPLHYSFVAGDTVVELYPLAQTQAGADVHLRLGFAITNFDAALVTLKENGTLFHMEARQTDFGYMAVVEDPEGRKVERYKK